ncbi:protein SPA1-RELATED 3-like isoform X2 [Prosopis cineraria]|uniref:protein SPA1-RELATED 3-like isoform X2 n=1 Tax=Prosopis cineraria TaxID=364024 RepID=UPI0024108878|nr:protein SPA1-RELATED 3-like isoform X2 [Prosopis cineraria]
MEGSSGSVWQKSNAFQVLNTSGVSDRNTRPICPDRSPYSGETSNNSSGFKKDKDRIVLALKNQASFSGVQESEVAVGPYIHSAKWADISLRQWLDKPERSVDVFECLHIFRQIVEIVNTAHCQGIVVHNVRPSCFVMSPFNNISFIESASCSDSGSVSLENGLNSLGAQIKTPAFLSSLEIHPQRILRSEVMECVRTSTTVMSNSSYMLSNAAYAARASLIEDTEENKVRNRIKTEEIEGKKQTFPLKQALLMETSWYTSPEEVAGSSSSCASDIYRLGVLLFELFCPFSSKEEKSRTMSSLIHRVLPPQLLLEWPKEATFCLWLLHPEPSSRPTLGELLQSGFLIEQRGDMEEREAAIELREKIEEQELLLEFLLLIQQRKKGVADNLQQTVSFLCSDIEEAAKQQPIFKEVVGSDLGSDDHLASSFPSMKVVESGDSADQGNIKHNVQECNSSIGDDQNNCGNVLSNNSRLMKNFKRLESEYFLMRCKSSKKPKVTDGRGSFFMTERGFVNNLASKDQCREDRIAWKNPFLDGLCKYLSFSKLKVKADLKQGDLLQSSNLVCALSFSREETFFATAGVSKKIKVFDYDSIINEDHDISYPVVEMASRSKLSSVCWNTYIKSQIASSNFEGVVQLWDVTRSRPLSEMDEHERRVWSIDFSSADPTMLASGSDDGSVKLWSINQGINVGTIKTMANVCSVQFSPDSGRFLAFGSADHRIYYYDLRNLKMPLYTFLGHDKTVSYIKFVDSVNLVSASTDNTLKLWDFSACTSQAIDTPLQTFTGHMNVKNFVGLSVSDGFIATGSETNEVFIYNKVFPMPALSFKFQNTDPFSGQEVDDSAQFISSVCWRSQSNTLVAANSTGNIKILEMV